MKKCGLYNQEIPAATAAAKSLQSCPTLCDPMDCGLPGSTIHGIFQARVLEWGAIAFSDLVLVVSIFIIRALFHLEFSWLKIGGVVTI